MQDRVGMPKVALIVLCAGLINLPLGAAQGAAWADPKSLLGQGRAMVEKLVGASEVFSEHFTCGELLVYNTNVEHIEFTCTDSYCKSVTQEPIGARRQTELAVESCSDSQVSVFGSNGLSSTISALDFERSQSWLLGLLDAFAVYVSPMGVFEFKGARETEHGWIEAGRRSRLPTVTFDWDFSIGTAQVALELQVVVVPQWKGLRRVALVSGGGDDFLRLPGFVDLHRGRPFSSQP